MSENQEKIKKPKKESSKKKRLEISASAVIDNIVFNKDEVFAYYRVGNRVFDYLSTVGRVELAQRTNLAFINLMEDKRESLDGHFIVTNVPIDLDAWESQVRETVSNWETSPSFEKYLKEQKEFLSQEEYMYKITYLGISLGKRGALNFSDLNILERGFKGALETLKKWFNQILVIPDHEVSADEERSFRAKEKELYTQLSTGYLNVEKCNSEELLLLIKRQFYPRMPVPYLDIDHGERLGPGDLDLELYSSIKNKYRWLEITQQIGEHTFTGYRACLTLSKFHKFSDYPNQGFPFFYFPASLQLPFTMYSRFTLHPSSAMKKQVDKKRMEQKDELENMAGARSAIDNAVSGTPTDVSDSIESIQILDEILTNDKTPWVEGSYRIVVETPREDVLRKYCSLVKNEFSGIGINVTWSSGDQAELFLEQMPGDRLRIKSFQQLTNINMLGTSGFNFSSNVGDPIYGSDGEAR